MLIVVTVVGAMVTNSNEILGGRVDASNLVDRFSSGENGGRSWYSDSPKSGRIQKDKFQDSCH